MALRTSLLRIDHLHRYTIQNICTKGALSCGLVHIKSTFFFFEDPGFLTEKKAVNIDRLFGLDLSVTLILY